MMDEQIVKLGDRIFEEFFVVGVSAQSVRTFEEGNPNIKQGVLMPQYLFSYPMFNDDYYTDSARRRILHEFCFPFGVPIQQIRCRRSFSQINELLFSNNPREMAERNFLFTLKAEEDLPQQFNTVLSKLNPHNNLYCICITSKDYLETTPSNFDFADQA